MRIKNRMCTRTVVTGFFQRHISLNHRPTAVRAAKTFIMRKKFALLRRMLHICESTSSIYSTTSRLRGGSARLNRIATICIAWYLRASSSCTERG
uniref:Uncharacterized protein n=1 Tax=Picea sitchensis TaxID=3332 RepID=C0PSM0_PICSI|nr:unknown [Picea sitchensis]